MHNCSLHIGFLVFIFTLHTMHDGITSTMLLCTLVAWWAGRVLSCDISVFCFL